MQPASSEGKESLEFQITKDKRGETKPVSSAHRDGEIGHSLLLQWELCSGCQSPPKGKQRQQQDSSQQSQALRRSTFHLCLHIWWVPFQGELFPLGYGEKAILNDDHKLQMKL